MNASDFFNGWYHILRPIILAVLGYLALVVMIRTSGKRTLSKMNVFDFVFVVALGSTLASTIMNQDVALAEGLAALASLIGVQVILSWMITKSERLESFINGNPVLLFTKGNYLRDIMRRERVTEEEINAAVRNEGEKSIDDVEAVVLETDGTFTVVRRQRGDGSSLSDVKGYGEPFERRRKAGASSQ